MEGQDTSKLPYIRDWCTKFFSRHTIQKCEENLVRAIPQSDRQMFCGRNDGQKEGCLLSSTLISSWEDSDSSSYAVKEQNTIIIVIVPFISEA